MSALITRTTCATCTRRPLRRVCQGQTKKSAVGDGRTSRLLTRCTRRTFEGIFGVLNADGRYVVDNRLRALTLSTARNVVKSVFGRRLRGLAQRGGLEGIYRSSLDA
eukprot:4387988-Pyramimonas_sp.AAC.1